MAFDWGRQVLDVIYIAVTIAFFALMLAFVRGLESLGRDPALQDKEHP
jgi:hypothetical protein